MRYVELFKLVDKKELMVAGMFTEHELRILRAEGYREQQINKNGIRVA